MTLDFKKSYAKPDSAQGKTPTRRPLEQPPGTHERLQDDYAKYLIQYNRGPSIMVFKEQTLENGRRADIAKLTYPWDLLTIYEIKARRPDFLHEMSTGKWEEYFPAYEVVFVTPHDLVGPHEIPEGAGWITQGPRGGFRRRKTGYQDPTYRVSRRQLQILLQRTYGG